MDFHTTDLCDAHSDVIQIAAPGLRDYGGKTSFFGPISTVRTFEDNSLVRQTLERAGKGGVLVVDGGGSLRCALLGDQLGELAVENGWQGIIVNGCVRDSKALSRLDVGVKALNTHPLKSVKRDYGDENVPVNFSGVTFKPGHYVYADPDGVVIAPDPL